ncbi:hypothetical protein [Labrys wisconsinensis]|uniref:Glycine transporter domain-containing protein n=1 Tax=Labrys wisconsinensis TaxID=425677 RepID=A0ABU0J2D6_9HYPH|nr:hypothetical protein [Labrys wisconsinensis]MDQ0468423.1 hypothetical protein [Labrys wisconsinensis]
MDWSDWLDLGLTAVMAGTAVRLYTGQVFAAWDYLLAAIVGAYAAPFALHTFVPEIEDLFVLFSGFGGALIGCLVRDMLPKP